MSNEIGPPAADRAAIVCCGDGYHLGRAVVALATAGLFDPADLFLVTPAPLPATPRPIRVLAAADMWAQLSADGDVGPFADGIGGHFLRYPAALWLMTVGGYHRVLYLDTDCLVLGVLDEVWAAARESGLAACPDWSSHFPEAWRLPGEGDYRGPVTSHLLRSPPPVRRQVLELLDITFRACRATLHLNTGVLAFSRCTPVIELLRRCVRDTVAHGGLLAQLFNRDQDYFNPLMVAVGLRPAILDPVQFNFIGAHPDKRIVHFAALARERITHLWRPHAELVCRAMERLRMPYKQLLTDMPVEPMCAGA